MPKISGLPPMNSPADDDVLPIDDDSVADPTSPDKTKKISLSTLKTYFQSLAGWITTAMLANGAVTAAKTTGIWYEELGRNNNSGQTTLTVSNLPERNFLRLIITFGHSQSLVSSLRFNGSAGSNYSWQAEINNGSLSGASSTSEIQLVPSASTASNRTFVVDIDNSRTVKTMFFYGSATNAVTSVPGIWTGVGAFNSASKITSVQLRASAGNLENAQIVVLGHD